MPCKPTPLLERAQEVPIEERQAAETAASQAYTAKGAAAIAWIKTEPTTLAGVIASLEYASQPYDRTDRPLLADYAGCEEAEQYPAMIATALGRITAQP